MLQQSVCRPYTKSDQAQRKQKSHIALTEQIYEYVQLSCMLRSAGTVDAYLVLQEINIGT